MRPISTFLGFSLTLTLLSVCALDAHSSPQQPSASEPAQIELEELARNLRRTASPAAYARLSAFAKRNSASELGARAALALGHHDHARARYAQALAWFAQAERDVLLREYTLYWSAQANRALSQHVRAVAQLQQLRREFPESVMTEHVVQALAESALALGRPRRAFEALEAYAKTESRPALLALRAQARARAGRKAEAAADYQQLYFDFPLSAEAKLAGPALQELRQALGDNMPLVSLSRRVARAAVFFEARRWREARAEYAKILPALTGADRERAQLRLAQCRVQVGADLQLVASLSLTAPEVDAERLYVLLQLQRAAKREAEMLSTLEALLGHFPQSRWADEALFAAASYFWLNLERTRAAEFYGRALERLPANRNAMTAHWRLAWVAYLERRPEAAAQFEEHLRRFANTPYAANALYWLGRAAEQAGDTPRARAFYVGLIERFPQTYFGLRAAERFRAIGAGLTSSAEVLSAIPVLAPLPAMDAAIPPAAEERWQRALALRSIAFDASAELELKAAYATTPASLLLLEAARAARDAERYPAGIVAAQQLAPQLESRRLEDAPEEVWRAVYPLPYAEEIQQNAERAGLDPMLVAGLIRQESLFQRDAVSRAGAVGLMQILPKSGRRLARALRLRYSRARLFRPEYNLHLGTTYLAQLIRDFGGLEPALAAYNGGEERVKTWLAERNFAEAAEFVESVPITETREYVQLVLRNAEIYRRLYQRPEKP